MRSPKVLALAAAVGLLVVVPSGTMAAGTGCPTWGNPGGNPGTRDGQLMSIDAAVQRTMAQLTDAWFVAVGTTAEQVTADRTAALQGTDLNGDGWVCVVESWGTELNPNSKWATFWGDLLNPPESQKFLAVDNKNGTSNHR